MCFWCGKREYWKLADDLTNKGNQNPWAGWTSWTEPAVKEPTAKDDWTSWSEPAVKEPTANDGWASRTSWNESIVHREEYNRKTREQPWETTARKAHLMSKEWIEPATKEPSCKDDWAGWTNWSEATAYREEYDRKTRDQTFKTWYTETDWESRSSWRNTNDTVTKSAPSSYEIPPNTIKEDGESSSYESPPGLDFPNSVAENAESFNHDSTKRSGTGLKLRARAKSSPPTRIAENEKSPQTDMDDEGFAVVTAYRKKKLPLMRNQGKVEEKTMEKNEEAKKRLELTLKLAKQAVNDQAPKYEEIKVSSEEITMRREISRVDRAIKTILARVEVRPYPLGNTVEGLTNRLFNPRNDPKGNDPKWEANLERFINTILTDPKKTKELVKDVTYTSQDRIELAEAVWLSEVYWESEYLKTQGCPNSIAWIMRNSKRALHRPSLPDV